MIPVKRVSAITKAGISGLPYADTIRDMIAVGPKVISLLVPKIQYTKQPIKAEYRPYCGGKPATRAYARPCGTTINPTVNPAIMSNCKALRLYLGSHLLMGNLLAAYSLNIFLSHRSEQFSMHFCCSSTLVDR
jgi:hypothetical protein